jgi:hypothetical protein
MLRLSLVSCPIYLSPATSEAERIRLNMINPQTGHRISMKTVDAETGEPLERSETVKGYEIEKGRYVIVTDEELKNARARHCLPSHEPHLGSALGASYCDQKCKRNRGEASMRLRPADIRKGVRVAMPVAEM